MRALVRDVGLPAAKHMLHTVMPAPLPGETAPPTCSGDLRDRHGVVLDLAAGSYELERVGHGAPITVVAGSEDHLQTQVLGLAAGDRVARAASGP